MVACLPNLALFLIISVAVVAMAAGTFSALYVSGTIFARES